MALYAKRELNLKGRPVRASRTEQQKMTEKKNAGRERQIYRVTLLGSVCNLLLTAFKFLAGILGGSAAMVADAVHSLSDLATDIVVIVFVRIAGKPVDKEHDFGHGKYETLATAIIGLALVGVGVGIFWNGASTIYAVVHGEALAQPGTIAFVAAVLSIVTKEALYQYTARSGKRLGSQAMIANAWHHRSDALSSIGTAVGIGGAIFLGEKWRVLDPLAAVAVSFFIVKVGFQLLIPCVDELLEKSLPDDEEQFILDTILEQPGVADPHHLRTRRIGNYCAIEVHFRMDGHTTLEDAHAATRAIEDRLREKFGPDTLINTHVEPFKQPCAGTPAQPPRGAAQ